MPKATSNLGEVTNRVYGILHLLEEGDRARVLNSVHQLFGSISPSPNGTTGNPPSTGASPPRPDHAGVSAKDFYAHKNPATKGESTLSRGELLAVAARYREQYKSADHHTAEDFSAFFKDARQNFDKKNFVRDMKNAQHVAKLFNTGGPRGQYQLSYYGQQFIDALPDREAARKIKRPGRKKTKKKGS